MKGNASVADTVCKRQPSLCNECPLSSEAESCTGKLGLLHCQEKLSSGHKRHLSRRWILHARHHCIYTEVLMVADIQCMVQIIFDHVFCGIKGLLCNSAAAC